jgi:transcriptional regulator with XRE-family HTH domain
MQAIRFGRILRALRRRRGWRQLDLAARARCSQQSISRLERGDLVGASLGTIQRVLAALEADVDLAIRWRGGTIDRLVDAGHARLVDAVTRRLARLGFDVRPEVSYAEFGERGSIDILAIDVRARILIVVEVKTELTSMEATLRKHDEKVRLAPTIVRRRLGLAGPWRVVPILVLPESGASRRRVTGHAAVLDPRYPLRGRDLAARLAARQVTDGDGGLFFLPLTHGASERSGGPPPHRVRRPHASSAEHDAA